MRHEFHWEAHPHVRRIVEIMQPVLGIRGVLAALAHTRPRPTQWGIQAFCRRAGIRPSPGWRRHRGNDWTTKLRRDPATGRWADKDAERGWPTLGADEIRRRAELVREGRL